MVLMHHPFHSPLGVLWCLGSSPLDRLGGTLLASSRHLVPAVALARKKSRLVCLTHLLLPLCSRWSCPDVLSLPPRSRLVSVLVQWLRMVLWGTVLPSLHSRIFRWRRGFCLGLPPCSRPQPVMWPPTLAALSVPLKSSAFSLPARPPRTLPTLALLRGRSFNGPPPCLPCLLFLVCQPLLVSLRTEKPCIWWRLGCSSTYL